MKKYLLIALIAFVGWRYYHNKSAEQAIADDAEMEPVTLTSERRPINQTQQPAFQCDGRVYCSEMGSRAEAEFFIKHCPDTKMDGDNDGVPCENDSRF